jgi:hypothetical protein
MIIWQPPVERESRSHTHTNAPLSPPPPFTHTRIHTPPFICVHSNRHTPKDVVMCFWCTGTTRTVWKYKLQHFVASKNKMNSRLYISTKDIYILFSQSNKSKQNVGKLTKIDKNKFSKSVDKFFVCANFHVRLAITHSSAKLVARLLATADLLHRLESRHFSKIQNGQHKHRSGQHMYSSPQKSW